jgi:hypothetical protein
MLEPIQIDDLDQLGNIVVAVTLPLPDGREAVVKLRPLTAKEVRDIRRSIEWPEPPVKDFKKDTGNVAPVYDFQNKEYKRRDEEADALLVKKMLVASLLMRIPGETTDEKCAALDERLGQFAITYLVNVMNRINTPAADEVAKVMRSFRAVGVAGASGNGQPLLDPFDVAHVTEVRAR